MLPAAWGLPGKFPALRTLNLSFCTLSEPLPATWFATAESFPALRALGLAGNALQGAARKGAGAGRLGSGWVGEWAGGAGGRWGGTGCCSAAQSAVPPLW